MKFASLLFRHTWMFTLSGKLARWIVPWLPRWAVYNRLNDWGRHRELPEFPKRSFRELYRDRHDRQQ
jgi:L-lactate dehydrogenase complex protein LldF